VEELPPGTKEELVNLVIATWKAASMSLVNGVVDSSPKWLQEVIQKQGNSTNSCPNLDRTNFYDQNAGNNKPLSNHKKINPYENLAPYLYHL
jgi:hypothetical protein